MDFVTTPVLSKQTIYFLRFSKAFKLRVIIYIDANRLLKIGMADKENKHCNISCWMSYSCKTMYYNEPGGCTKKEEYGYLLFLLLVFFDGFLLLQILLL